MTANSFIEPQPNDESHQQKDVEYYAASVGAWYSTSLEYDKSLFTLSAGGIGLLITLITTLGIKSLLFLGLYFLAIAAFLACVVTLLIVFRLNRNHLELVLKDSSLGLDPLLKRLDLVAISAFGGGAVLSAAIGVSAAVHSYANKENELEIKRRTNLPVDQNKSFSGSGSLRPQPIEGTPAPTPAPAAPAPTASTPSSPAPAPAPTASTPSSPTPAPAPTASTPSSPASGAGK